MSKPIKKDDTEVRAAMPPELGELDRELSAIRIEERASFGPELERELARSWESRSARVPLTARPWARHLMAACLAGVMIVGVAVPSARALVVEFVQTVMEAVAPSAAAPAPEVRMPDLQVQEPVRVPSITPTEVVSSPSPLPTEEEFTEAAEMVNPPVVITFPALQRREEAKALIASFYPLALQQAGVGGSVKLVFWVGEDGEPENIRIGEGSGYRSLNYAAMRSAREFLFEPATRNGEAVGTWVEFRVEFVPGPERGSVELDPVGSGGVGST